MRQPVGQMTVIKQTYKHTYIGLVVSEQKYLVLTNVSKRKTKERRIPHNNFILVFVTDESKQQIMLCYLWG